MLNTGFIVAQNLPATRRILGEWLGWGGNCTSTGTGEGKGEGEREGCSKWAYREPWEQAALAEYMRGEGGGEGIRVSTRISRSRCVIKF